ncbi:chorismate synthase [Desnuesiella massiliensis]|uniref:chorismate synthase n=1 Tax=Desnuesiella massiliensis TaxID=1650662 RepID=UPI0006E29C1E|nr:chorismate synthase [Desnuesiella massiliensis]
MLRFLDGGESHGKALVAILEGFPSNFHIDVEEINKELQRRQQGYGRGKRMSIEKDQVEIWSGLRGDKTTGAPITMIIKNKDYENWKDFFNREAKEEEKIKIIRPGHGDLVGFYKYKTGDIRDAIERTSARNTAIRTAIGALCKQLLKSLDIDIRSMTKSVGAVYENKVNLFNEDIYTIIQNSDIRCYNKPIEEKIKAAIDKCKLEGDTIGGSVFISIKGVPLGIGSYTQWDRKLDAIISMGIMSVQAVKAIAFGEGFNSNIQGSEFNDEAYFKNNEIIRGTNHAGGIEAGVSNGENIDITAFIKPIPSVKKGIASINLASKENVISRYERSDVCAVIPAAVVIENVCAFHILSEILNKFPSDEYNELKRNFYDYKAYLKKM